MIPWAKPVFWGNEEASVLDALRSTWISGGPYLDKLEAEFKALTGRTTALAVSNGTAAIHVAYLALGIKPGDEIIVPGFGFLAAANLALQFGAVPIFAEVDPDTWCVTAEAIAHCITPRTRLIVVVHTYGNVCEMGPVMALAARCGIKVLEDTAEALGSTEKDRPAGGVGDFGTFSFQATKTIACGEGGMVVTSDPELAEKMFLYRSHGLYRKKHYWHEVPGNNFRLTNLQAALAWAQLQKIETIRTSRMALDAGYRRELRGTPGVRFQHFDSDVNPLLWAFAVELDPAHFPQGRDVVETEMATAGVEIRPGFVAPSLMPHLYRTGSLPISVRLSRWVISLPSYASITHEEIQRVCFALSASCKSP